MTEETRMILNKLDAMDQKMDTMEGTVKTMGARMDTIEGTVKTMCERANVVENKVTDIQMTLENETNKNIQIVAEGHYILNRKLGDALKVEAEKEMLLLKVNHMETEIRQIKTRIEEIA